MSIGLDNIKEMKRKLFFESLHRMRKYKEMKVPKTARHYIYIGYRAGCIDAELLGSHTDV